MAAKGFANFVIAFSHHPLPIPLLAKNTLCQVVRLVDDIFKREGLSLRLRPYDILCCGDMKGLVECITDAKSVDHIKKATAKTGGIRVSEPPALESWVRILPPPAPRPPKKTKKCIDIYTVFYTVFSFCVYSVGRHFKCAGGGTNTKKVHSL